MSGLDPAQAAGAVAQPGLATAGASPAVDLAQDTAGQSVFSPFSTIGIVVHRPAILTPQSQDGDWALPVVVMLVGVAFIGALLRQLVR